jgi:hypothetical protein
VLLRQAYQYGRLGGIHRERLLADHMLASLQSRFRLREVEMVWGAYVHNVY